MKAEGRRTGKIQGIKIIMKKQNQLLSSKQFLKDEGII